jgi:hypothetical protein
MTVFRLTNIEELLEDLNNKFSILIVATASRRKSWIARLFSRSWHGPDPNSKPNHTDNPHDSAWNLLAKGGDHA